MKDHELVDYIGKQISKGFQMDEIRDNLLNIGWPKKDVDSAVNNYYGGTNNQKVGLLCRIQMLGKLKLGFSVIMVIAAVVLAYSAFTLISLDNGGMSGYITKDDEVLSIDYTNCHDGEVLIILRNLDSASLLTDTEISITRLNDNTKLEWDTSIEPGKTGSFRDYKCNADDEKPCRYAFEVIKYGIKKEISIRCS